MNKQMPQRSTVAEFLADRLAAIDKTQRQVSEECGFDNPNIITMFKTGQTKLPVNRIAALAKALEVNPVHLLRLVMLEYIPDLWESIENIMQSTVLSANELELARDRPIISVTWCRRRMRIGRGGAAARVTFMLI